LTNAKLVVKPLQLLSLITACFILKSHSSTFLGQILGLTPAVESLQCDLVLAKVEMGAKQKSIVQRGLMSRWMNGITWSSTRKF